MSRAADRPDISQPAVKPHAKRLRDLTGDVILVRTRSGMAPTPRAPELVSHATRASTASMPSSSTGRSSSLRTVRGFGIAAPDCSTRNSAAAPDRAHRPPGAARPAVGAAAGADADYERLLELATSIWWWPTGPDPPPYLGMSPWPRTESVMVDDASHLLAKRACSARRTIAPPTIYNAALRWRRARQHRRPPGFSGWSARTASPPTSAWCPTCWRPPTWSSPPGEAFGGNLVRATAPW